MGREEPQEAGAGSKEDRESSKEAGQEQITVTSDPPAFLEKHASWLLDPELGVCAVGSVALGEACRRAGVPGPQVGDLDLAWALDLDTGNALLETKGVLHPTTEANRDRGTLAMKLDEHRIEITTFRNPDTAVATTMEDRIVADLHGRDMTVGALAWWLSKDRILDPLDGLEHWRQGKIVPVGDPEQRIREHPIRWLRYYRRAHQWGFDLDARIRKVDIDTRILDEVPREAVAAEVRAALLDCRSPGCFLMELFEIGILERIAPELARQFDGRVAGPIRHHPEVSQALHLILSLEWIRARTTHLPDNNRLMAGVAVLCHDMGKGFSDARTHPSHHGHENQGVAHVRRLLDRLPGLADAATRRLAEAVCALHTQARGLENLRPGTRARLYQRWFKDKSFPVQLFALALGADVGGRLGMAAAGEQTACKVERDVNFLRRCCGQVDVGRLFKLYGADKRRFHAERHEAFARALRAWKPGRS